MTLDAVDPLIGPAPASRGAEGPSFRGPSSSANAGDSLTGPDPSLLVEAWAASAEDRAWLVALLRRAV